MDSLNSSISLNTYLASQTPSGPDQPNQKNSGSPASAQAKEPSDVSTDESATPYESSQGSQVESGTPRSNNNTTSAQTFKPTQNSTFDPNLGDSNNETETNNSEEAPQIANTGLSLDQQVNRQQGSAGDQNSGRGSDHHSKETRGIDVRDAGFGLQKREGRTDSLTFIDQNEHVSNFSLKIDSRILTTSTSSTERTGSSTYVDPNGAPAIPPPKDPNVFAMIAEGAELSVNLQGATTQDMVAAAKGMNANLSSEYTKQISDINNYIKSAAKAKAKAAEMKTIGIATDVVMFIVAVITCDPVLFMAAVASTVMTADPKITQALASELQKMGMSPQVANIMATVMIVLAASAGGMSIASVAEDTVAATTSAAQASIKATEDGAESFAEGASLSSNMTDAGRTATSLTSSEGRAAFTQSLQDSFSSGVRESYQSIKDSSQEFVSSIYNAPKNIADSTKALYNLAGKISERCIAFGSKGLLTDGADTSETVQVSTLQKLIEQLKSTASSLTDDPISSIAKQLKSVASNLISDPVKAVHITCDLTMAALTATGAVYQYEGAMAQGKAEKDQSNITAMQAATTEISSLITLSNTQVQSVLSDMNNDITGAGTVLSGITLKIERNDLIC